MVNGPDEAKAILMQKFTVNKQYRLGQNYGDLYGVVEEMKLDRKEELCGYYHCPNPFSWSVYEGAEFAIMTYSQQYGEGFNTYTIFGKDKKVVMALVESFDAAGIIKRPKRK
jgi:hypothetical protein